MKKSLLVTALCFAFSAVSACDAGVDLSCEDGEPFINGNEFSCSECKKAQGCHEVSGGWECPRSADLTCLINSTEGRYCCGDHCIDCP